MDNFSNTEKWREAYNNFFLLRIETRFIKPVKLIINSISPDESKSGEGFTITAILCILIEYLQAYYEGCNYTTGEPKLYEYKSSKAMFKNFLTMHEPFKTFFLRRMLSNSMMRYVAVCSMRQQQKGIQRSVQIRMVSCLKKVMRDSSFTEMHFWRHWRLTWNTTEWFYSFVMTTSKRTSFARLMHSMALSEKSISPMAAIY